MFNTSLKFLFQQLKNIINLTNKVSPFKKYCNKLISIVDSVHVQVSSGNFELLLSFEQLFLVPLWKELASHKSTDKETVTSRCLHVLFMGKRIKYLYFYKYKKFKRHAREKSKSSLY